MKINSNYHKSRLLNVLILTVLMLMVSSVSIADEFEEMKAEMDAFNADSGEGLEFDQYRDQINSEFETYKKIIDQEYRNFRKEILVFWDKPEMTSKKKFVEYTPDMKTKKIVDFEKGELQVSIIKPKGTPKKKIDKELKEKLKDLVTEDSSTAFERDKFAKSVEKKIKKAVKNIKTDTVKNVPIITDVVTGTTKPTKKQVDKAVDKLITDGVVKTKPAKKVPGSEIVTIKIKLPSNSMKKKAEEYIDSVKKYSKKRNIDPALVLAVMQTESAFNPMARSYVPAYGLMQIVPKSAGLDASQEVYGKQVVLSPSYLYDGENNVNMGTTYLYILNYKYLKAIKNDESRLYCVIAAYNTGAGNVARTFTGKTNIRAAAKKINKMSPEKVYKKLLKNLPHEETRRYMKNVTSRMELYR